jgi:hypothetical protein
VRRLLRPSFDPYGWRHFDNASAEVLQRVSRGAQATVTATTETALFTSQSFAGGAAGDGEGGFWYPGKTVRMWASGLLTTIGTAGTITLNWRLNSISGNSLGASVAITPAISITKGSWLFEGRITCRSIGSSGTLIGQGGITFGSTVVTTTSPGRTWLMPDVNPDATATIDTTAASTSILLTVLQTQGHTWIAQMGGVEVLN